MIDFFDRGARNAPNRVCMVTADGAVSSTYSEVRARSNRIGNALIADGFAPGAHGAVLSGNNPRAFEAILGILRADGVWVMANNRASVDENVGNSCVKPTTAPSRSATKIVESPCSNRAARNDRASA